MGPVNLWSGSPDGIIGRPNGNNGGGGKLHSLNCTVFILYDIFLGQKVRNFPS